jgi:O-antigen/teichoic acid export membrane protein
MVTPFFAFFKRPVAKSATILTSGSLFAQIVTIVNAIVLARYLAPESYGTFVACYSVSVLTSFFFNLGMDTWLLRYGVVDSNTPQLVGRIFILKAILGLIWGSALLFTLPSLKTDLFLTPLLLFSAVDTWSDGLFNTQLSALKSASRIAWASGLFSLCRVGRLLSAIVLINLGFNSPTPFAQARLVITNVTLLFSFVALSPRFPKLSGLLTIVHDSIPFTVSDLLAAIYLQADVTLLSILMGNGRAVGLYAIALGLVNGLFVIPSSIYNIMVPALTRHFTGERSYFQSLVTKMVFGFLALGIVMSLALGIGGGYVTQLILGPSYDITGELLMILSPILFLKSVSFGAAAFLVTVEWQSNRVAVQLGSACTNIALNLWAIPRFGIWGAAGTYLISELVLALGYSMLMLRWFGSQHNEG